MNPSVQYRTNSKVMQLGNLPSDDVASESLDEDAEHALAFAAIKDRGEMSQNKNMPTS